MQHSRMFLLFQMLYQLQPCTGLRYQNYNYLIHSYMPNIVSKEICSGGVLRSLSGSLSLFLLSKIKEKL